MKNREIFYFCGTCMPRLAHFVKNENLALSDDSQVKMMNIINLEIY